MADLIFDLRDAAGVFRLRPLPAADLYLLAQDDPKRARAIVEARLHRAVEVMATLPSDGLGASRSAWPDFAHDADAETETDPAPTIARPETGEIDEADRVLMTLKGSPPRTWRIVTLRAFDRSWRAIGRRVGVSHEMARLIHRDAVDLSLAQWTKARSRGCSQFRTAIA